MTHILQSNAYPRADVLTRNLSIVSMKPWEYDHTIHPIEWRTSLERDAREQPKFRVGVLRSDGTVEQVS